MLYNENDRQGIHKIAEAEWVGAGKNAGKPSYYDERHKNTISTGSSE